MFVAAIGTTNKESKRPMGDYSCFFGDTKDEAVSAALDARAKWQQNGSGRYKIYVGELTEEVVVPVQYELKKIEPTSFVRPELETGA